MLDKHLTTQEIEQHAENELDSARRVEIEQHLAACAACRARLARDARVNIALRALPRTQPPRELGARIGAAIEAHALQEQTRRARLPLIAFATFVSLLLALWFGLEMIVALQENDVLDFFTLFTSYPDWFAPDSLDALTALIEALPIPELILTLCALLTVGVLAQQLVDSARPRAWQFK
jgi:predicted anti-sigma-YlaC factor YlaD